MKPTILFIHGMFLNGHSWSEWVNFFEWRGHRALAPAWPLHGAPAAELRAQPPRGAGELTLDVVLAAFARAVEAEPEPPILVGHSVGGLIVQRLVAAGLARAGVCIASVAPRELSAMDPEFLGNIAPITDLSAGDSVFEMTEEGFHQTFANTLAREDSDRAYAEFATHESRNVLRDCLGKAGDVDLHRPHAPLLFIAGDRDQIVPDTLCERNARAYTDAGSVADYRLFPGRGHFICGEPGWDEIATGVADWLQIHADVDAPVWAGSGRD